MARPADTGFATLDELCSSPASHGLVHVRAAEDGTARAFTRHFWRRARQVQRRAVIGAGAEPVRALALALGVLDDESPTALAVRIADAAAGGLLLVLRRAESAWGRAVLDALAGHAAEPERSLLVLVVTPAEAEISSPTRLRPRADRPGAVSLGALAPADVERFWQAVVASDELFARPAMAQLATLDAWWERARGAGGPGQAEALAPQPDDGRPDGVLAWLDAADEPLSAAELCALGAATGLADLARRGVVAAVAGGRYGAAVPGDVALGGAAAEELLCVLSARPQRDAWLAMRMSELAAASGDARRAELLAIEALGLTHEPTARDDLWRRWEALLAARGHADPRDELGVLLRSAERALGLGDGDRADAFARRAAALDGERFDVQLLRGRTCRARGDLTTATLVLLRAVDAAPDAGLRSEALAALAEARYGAGDLAEARRFAERALELAATSAGKLGARNVLGKLLLAEGAWDAAERHFALDALDAARTSSREAELRARLNGAIAVLQAGRRAQAQALLGAVLAEAEGEGALRAVAYALANLATIAIHDLDLPHALELSERAIALRHQVGARASLARPLTNLAELRLRLGLDAEAEQALHFGLQVCGPTLPLGQHAYFALVAARIHLDRGQTAEAAAELAAARTGAAAGGDRDLVGECERLGARIALADGDVLRAEAALACAAQHGRTAAARAEIALLEAAVARATGAPYLEAARTALRLAQEVSATELVREAFELASHALREQGDLGGARRMLFSALGERDRLLCRLPEALRERFLGRPEMRALGRLEQSLGTSSAPAASDSRPAVVAGAPSERRARKRDLVGESAAMLALRRTIARVAPSDASVLVTGPTGSGKELVAEALHGQSRRRAGPLVKVHCAALVETLLLSELFGHERGAFTGAAGRKRGRFELADGGTLFLDEVGDISPRTQVALLRVLQDGTFERVGGTTPVHVDVRVVCATHRDLAAMVQRGEFREDLYYRLCGVRVDVPALAERLADLPAIGAALLEQVARESGTEVKRLGPDALRALAQHSWPGNVRELENVLRTAALFAKGQVIEPAELCEQAPALRAVCAEVPVTRRSGPSHVAPSVAAAASPSEIVYAEVRSGTSFATMKRRLERECVARALADAGGNITRAAEMLGMKRPRLSQLVKQYKLATTEETRS
ncbi:MAG: sigma 54-interacting transcriptional regulator [Polyangiaceae bacterium]|nr:sigma 54-interacting transcriptional regulator [Polyangiaceae bacterium]